MNHSIIFRVVGHSLNYHVGGEVVFSDCEIGRITSIRSVRHLGDERYEIIGRYKPIK